MTPVIPSNALLLRKHVGRLQARIVDAHGTDVAAAVETLANLERTSTDEAERWAAAFLRKQWAKAGGITT